MMCARLMLPSGGGGGAGLLFLPFLGASAALSIEAKNEGSRD
jgi:hypothetical protein